MNELTGNITVLSMILIGAVTFVTVGIFVMFAILCANVAQIKRTLRKLYDVTSKRKNQISVGYIKPKV